MFRKFRLLMLALIIHPLLVYSLPTDKNEKLHITSHDAYYNYKTGINCFNGNVKADQGTSHLLADKLTTKRVNQAIKEMIAYGETKLAHYWTIPKLGDLPLHAKAKIIKFYPDTHDIILEKEVVITQGKNTFSGQVIHYNSKQQTITVPPTKNGRAVIVYHPNN